MAKKPQQQADWVEAEDQIYLGRYARMFALDPGVNEANRFIKMEHFSEVDRQWLDLFDSIEACEPDIDDKIEGLHQTWKQLDLLTRSWWRLKVPYLIDSVAWELYERSKKLGTPSSMQMRMNWYRLSHIVNAQGNPAWRVGDYWVGPAKVPSPQADLGGPERAVQEPPRARRWKGWMKMGSGIYAHPKGGMMTEWPIALFVAPFARVPGPTTPAVKPVRSS